MSATPICTGVAKNDDGSYTCTSFVAVSEDTGEAVTQAVPAGAGAGGTIAEFIATDYINCGPAYRYPGDALVALWTGKLAALT